MLGDIHGDMMFEGRHGNSIRIGSRNVNPVLIISNGQAITNTQETSLDGSIISMFTFGTIGQHFNNDGTEAEPYVFRLADAEPEGVTRTIESTFTRALGRGLGTAGEDNDDVSTTIYGIWW